MRSKLEAEKQYGLKEFTEYTSGPWDYDVYDGHDALACHDGNRDYTARIEWRGDIPDEERLANLHLIIAAPELLEALKNLVADWERVHGKLNQEHEAHAAIAKAEGRG